MGATNPDLTDAVELLDWADKRIEELSARDHKFLQDHVKFSHTNTAPGYSNVYVRCDADPRPIFAADVKAIIQAQRSTLDYVAVALAKANGANNLTDTLFPVTRSAEEFEGREAQKKIRRLNPQDVEIIRSLRPYDGGDNLIYALHRLNIEQKHRHLGVYSAAGYPTGVLPGPAGDLAIERISLFKIEGLGKEPKLVAQVKAKGQVKLRYDANISFTDFPGPVTDPAVTSVLRAFSATARNVIAKFGAS